MSIIDIREQVEVSNIIFADPTACAECTAIKLDRCHGYARLIDQCGNGACAIATKQDAQNLIKALQKAIELGWWD